VSIHDLMKERDVEIMTALIILGCVVIGSKAKATFTSQGGQQEVLTMKGNWLDTSADIIDEAMGGTSLPASTFYVQC
jgi:hypothetical protein